MAKKKKGRRRQGWFSKAINIGGWALGLSGIIKVILDHGVNAGPFLVTKLTFGLNRGLGGFSLTEGLEVYGPAVAVVPYRMFTSYLMRKFPVR